MSKEKKWWIVFTLTLVALANAIDGSSYGLGSAACIMLIALIVVACYTWT